MKNMTIGKKISLGFSLLIVIAMALGLGAFITMKSVQTQAKLLAQSFAPESQVAGDLQDAVAETRLAARSYGYTADDSLLAQARKGMEEIHKQQQIAQKLADEHPELVKLHEDLSDLAPVVQEFEHLISQTESKNKDLDGSREILDMSATDFISKIDRLIQSQKAMLNLQIKGTNDASAIQEHADMLALAVEIKGYGDAAGTAAFKSQALRNPQLIQSGLTNFTAMDGRIADLLALLKVPEDIKALNGIKIDAHFYRDAMKDVMDDEIALVDISARRTQVADKADSLVQDAQTSGAKFTVDAATTSNSRLASASSAVMAGLIVALLVSVTVAFFIIRSSNRVLRNVAQSLDDGSNQVSSAAGQVSAASQTLATGCSEQASSLEETSSSLEEMSSMTKRNSENARKANELAKEAREAADKAVVDMQSMAQAMDAIKISSDDIAKIIKTIDEIAFQTNILALNAAVEAARAGEAGMGFAVVADEVRNLAQRCAQAARETSNKIEGAITRTSDGVELSGKVADALNKIVVKPRQVDELVGEVSTASREQTEGIAQINGAVGQVDQVTQANAAGAEESASAAEELNAQAHFMKESVHELLELVGKKSTTINKTPSHTVFHKHPTTARLAPTNLNGSRARAPF